MSASVCNAAQAGLQRVTQALLLRRQQLDRQLQALASVQVQATTTPSPQLLLVLYLGLPSAKAVAELCNAQGLRKSGAKGPRRCEPGDVYTVVRNGAQGLCPELLDLARQKLEGGAAANGQSRYA